MKNTNWIKFFRIYVIIWIWIMFAFEAMESFLWMTQTKEMLLEHPKLGAFFGYQDIISSGTESAQRLPIIMGKWIGMCKGFWAGSLLAIALLSNNRTRTFASAWIAVGLTIMSLGLYPTLDEIALSFPTDFSNGFSGMTTLEAIFAMLSAIAMIFGIIVESKSKKKN